MTDRRLGKLQNAKQRIIEFFGDVKLDTVTAGAADDYGRWLLKQLAPATVQKECQIAAQFFRHAYRKGFIDKNPFEGVAVGKVTNDDRRVFVSREVILPVLEKCPDWQWRLVVALARYGGLRCPSAIALLRWSDIHWDAERFTVTSPKTERYGKATRVVPIFPELRPYLDDAYFRDDADKTWVVPMLAGNADKNLGTRFRKIIRRAGVEVWPKPFQNSQSIRQTELEQQYPTYVVCSWLGNTPAIAHKHCLTVTDEHCRATAKSGDKLGMQTPAGSRSDSHKKTRPVHTVRENASFSEVVAILENGLVAEEGLEPADVTDCRDNELRRSPNGIGTDSGTLPGGAVEFEPQLREVIHGWGWLTGRSAPRCLRSYTAQRLASGTFNDRCSPAILRRIGMQARF